jgi:hypothetical protein
MLDLNGPHWRAPEAFDDGEALFESVKIAGLEGIVAKKLQSQEPEYWRYGLEREP